MIRISFRQSMVAGFLLIALLLSWAAVRSWLLLEHFVEQSQKASEQALQLSASTQELAERTVELERSARQFMVLKDDALLARFNENVALSVDAVARLEKITGEGLGALPDAWRQSVLELRQSLHPSNLQTDLFPVLNRLAEVNSELERQGRRWIDAKNSTILSALENNRLHLTVLVAAAVVGAFLVALAMGWWLSRPIQTLERSIGRLGENLFDEPVIVRGPADLRQVGRRLDWLRLRLSELEADRERTLRHVSHELKTPLTALREGIALLQEGVVGSLDGTQQEVVDILQHNVMALQRQIESLLRLNAISFEAQCMDHQSVPLRELLAGVVQGRDLQIQARQLTVLWDAPEMTCSLDREKLQIVLDNLLSNAIDFSPQGGLIRLEFNVHDKHIRFSCIDQGPGVAPEDKERIYQPFVQGRLESPTPRQGSGVGLSIVRELMGAMGGRVWHEPGREDGSGSNFQIEVTSE